VISAGRLTIRAKYAASGLSDLEVVLQRPSVTQLFIGQQPAAVLNSLPLIYTLCAEAQRFAGQAALAAAAAIAHAAGTTPAAALATLAFFARRATATTEPTTREGHVATAALAPRPHATGSGHLGLVALLLGRRLLAFLVLGPRGMGAYPGRGGEGQAKEQARSCKRKIEPTRLHQRTSYASVIF